MTRTLAALAAAVIATGARAQTPPPAQPPPSDAPPAAAAPAAPAAAAPAAPAAPAAAAPAAAPKPKKGTYAIGEKSTISIAGRAWGEVNNVRADKGKGTAEVHNLTRFSSNSSYLRIAGERQFAEGFKAIAQVEAEFGLDGSGGSPFSGTRNTFVGIDTPFGSLIGGKFDSPAKETTIGRDPFGGTGIFGYYNGQTMYRADRRLNNALMYESPSFQGLTLLAAFSLGEATYSSVTTKTTITATPPATGSITQTTTKTGTLRVDPFTASGALHYKSVVAGNPLFVGVAYEYRKDCGMPDTEGATAQSCDRAQLGTDTQPNGVDQVIRVGADYNIKSTFTKLAVVYDHSSFGLDALNGQVKQSKARDFYWGSVTQGILSNKDQIVLNYGMATKYTGTNVGDTSKTGAQTFTAAYRHFFDPDFHCYVALTQIMNDDAQTQKIGSGGPAGFSAPAGSTVTGFGTGLRYNF